MPDASVLAKSSVCSYRQAGWRKRRMTSHLLSANKKGFSVGEAHIKGTKLHIRTVISTLNLGTFVHVTFGNKRANTKKRMMREAIIPVLIPAE